MVVTILNMLNQVRGGRFCFDFNFYLCIPLRLGDKGQQYFSRLLKKFLWLSKLSRPIFSIYLKYCFSNSYSVKAYCHIYFYYISPIVLFTYTLGSNADFFGTAFIQTLYSLSWIEKGKISEPAHLKLGRETF